MDFERNGELSITVDNKVRRNAPRRNAFVQSAIRYHESTPIRDANSFKNVRQSLAKVRQNSVAGMVELFSHPQKSVLSPYRENEYKQSPPLESGINKRITFFNEISAIGQRSDSVESMDVDSGFVDGDSRQRSQSVNASSSITSSARQSNNIIAAYKNYPNFKLEYLKYFGVNPKEYLSAHGCDVDIVSNLVMGEKEDIRRRSKSFGSKTVSWSMTVNGESNYSQSKYFEVDLNESFKSLQLALPQGLNSESIGDADGDVENFMPPIACYSARTNDSLKTRIRKSIKSYDTVLKSLSNKFIRIKRKEATDLEVQDQKRRKIF